MEKIKKNLVKIPNKNLKAEKNRKIKNIKKAIKVLQNYPKIGREYYLTPPDHDTYIATDKYTP